MNRHFRLLTFMLSLCLSIGVAMADIIENLNRTGSTVTVEQPQELADRLINTAAASGQDENSDEESEEKSAVPQTRNNGKIVGYRVQVYSDSNQRVAKGEARQRERAIGSRFPALATYVGYASPYWRLRVGDFRTQAEAQKYASDIRKAFPSYAKEIRVVRDRINAR
jgi:hypothetical protein